MNNQQTVETVYKGVNGEYYAGEEAWNFIKNRTGFDLKQILIDIADNKTPEKN
ncbi:ApaLI family restriction endonuclease [Geminocystis sp. GBBB08]|uniref:ApaLI family restriction endonuclease n=1 Tax=Geminocystis sp. GBBB08 TaxID=2604140 RepID=UPI0037C0451F